MHPSVQLPKKRPCQEVKATTLSGHKCSRHSFTVFDRTLRRKFLVDSGADVSIIPPTPTQKNHPDNQFSLQSADGRSIPTFGQSHLTLDLGLRDKFSWTFLIADVSTPIIGADFLAAFNFLVDCSSSTLIDKKTKMKVRGQPSNNGPIRLSWMFPTNNTFSLTPEAIPKPYETNS